LALAALRDDVSVVEPQAARARAHAERGTGERFVGRGAQLGAVSAAQRHSIPPLPLDSGAHVAVVRVRNVQVDVEPQPARAMIDADPAPEAGGEIVAAAAVAHLPARVLRGEADADDAGAEENTAVERDAGAVHRSETLVHPFRAEPERGGPDL